MATECHVTRPYIFPESDIGVCLDTSNPNEVQRFSLISNPTRPALWSVVSFVRKRGIVLTSLFFFRHPVQDKTHGSEGFDFGLARPVVSKHNTSPALALVSVTCPIRKPQTFRHYKPTQSGSRHRHTLQSPQTLSR